MDLLERYLAAIRMDLPAREADDILAELRDDLANRIEEREDMLGRPLGKAELSALLKEFGHPLVIAGRYRKHQYLIGPEAFPFFFAATRIVLAIVVGALLLAATVDVLVSHQEPVRRFAQVLGDLWPALLSTLGAMVVTFALLERAGFPAEHIRRWKPESLPDLKFKKPRDSWWEAPFEVAAGVAFLLWWTGVIHFPIVSSSHEVRVLPGPVWASYWWPILILVAARLVMSLIAWLRPNWRVARGLLNLATTVVAITLLVVIYHAGGWANISAPGMTPEQSADLTEGLDTAFRIAFVAVGMIWGLKCLSELWQLFRTRRVPV